MPSPNLNNNTNISYFREVCDIMALFKILKGNEANLPSTMTAGYAYFCPDTGRFFIDVENSSGGLERKKVSAEYADKLRYDNGISEIEIDPAIILTAHNYESKIGAATATKNGLMPSSAFSKLDDIEDGATKSIITLKSWTIADIGGV